MLSHYCTFWRISEIFQEKYVGYYCSHIYSQEERTLHLCITNNKNIYTIVISCQTSENFITMYEGDARAKKNTLDFFSSIINKSITKVFCEELDKVIHIIFENGEKLILQMFGAKANILFCGKDDTINDAFLHPQEYQNKKYSAEQKQSLWLLQEKSFFEELLKNQKETAIFSILKKVFPKLGTTVLQEILYRIKISPEQIFSINITDVLYKQTLNVIEEIKKTSQYYIYSKNEVPKTFSLIPLTMYEKEYDVQSFSDIFLAIKRFVYGKRSIKNFQNQKEEILTWLKNKEAHYNRFFEKKDTYQQTQRIQEYECYGNLLMMNLDKIQKGMKSIEVENIFSEQKEKISITLNPALTPVHNAELYFTKVKKIKTAEEQTQKRREENQKQFSIVQQLLKECETITSLEQLKEFITSPLLKEIGFMTKTEEEKLPPFRIFMVDGGFSVWAGKNSENNDILTLHYSEPEDLWFHCRGASGSHVVLKVKSAAGEPSKKAMEQAASIAAYYSKMKNATNVPVAMTKKKYVRKPRGVPAGTVTIERETVFFVKPILPS